MPLTIPPAVNYQSPLIALPTRFRKPPPEGDKVISVDIDWSTMGGADNCINFNLANNATLNFTQIVAVKYDNSESSGDVQLVFTDTGDTVTIPARSQAITPVFTNGQQFFIIGVSVVSGDVTRLQVLNSMPPPVDLSREGFPESTFAGNITVVDGAATDPVIAAGISGTIEALFITQQFFNNAPGNSIADISLVDGSANVIWSELLNIDNATQNWPYFIPLSPMSARFQNGLNLVQNNSGVPTLSGAISINATYRV